MEKKITFTLNGHPRSVTTEPDRPLLEVLREDLQLTGTKYGCGEGRCGACTVLMGGQSRRSCLTPVSEADQQNIITIEGLATGDRLHPVQEAFLGENGFQCGYCTPGIILGTVALLREKPNPTEADIRSRLEGHLCRCCAYPNILKAVQRAAAQTGK